MGKRLILTKEQRLLHNDPNLYKVFRKRFHGALEFYRSEELFERLFDEKQIKEWFGRINAVSDAYKIELRKNYYIPYPKDFFGLIHNRYDSFSLGDPDKTLRRVLDGFSILRDCLAGKI